MHNFSQPEGLTKRSLFEMPISQDNCNLLDENEEIYWYSRYSHKYE